MVFEFMGLGKKQQPEPVKPQIQIGLPTVSQQNVEEQKPRALEELENEVNRLKDSMNVVKESVKKMNEKLSDIEKTLSELASIYEIVLNQLNPFLDEEEKPLKLRTEKKRTASEKKEEPVEKEAIIVAETPKPEETGGYVLSYVDITNPKVIETIIDAVKFMVQKVGHTGIDQLLSYYVSIGWMNDEVADIFRKYAEGIRVEEEPELPDIQLEPEDHSRVLEYLLTIKEIQQR